MDIEDLKNTWKEEVLETPEISFEKQKEIHFPLEKIRKNMRMEFWNTLIIIFLILVALLLGLHNLKLQVYSVTLVLVAAIITAFYFRKFFNLYKEINDNNLSTKEALKDLLHQFELNKQYYISYYLAFAPVLVCELILFLEFGDNTNMNDFSRVLIFLFCFILSLIFSYWIGKWWFQSFYGKYIQRVKNILNLLE